MLYFDHRNNKYLPINHILIMVRLSLWDLFCIQVTWIFLLTVQKDGIGIHAISDTQQSLLSPVFNAGGQSITSPSSIIIKTSSAIDEQLYSRQIAVYGKSAQQKLLGAHIVVCGGSGSVAAEVLKNVAMAGVGKISIVKPKEDRISSSTRISCSTPHLKGSEDSLLAYAQSLNSLVMVCINQQTTIILFYKCFSYINVLL